MSLDSALTGVIRSLQAEESRIARELDTVRRQLEQLSSLGRRGPGRPPGKKRGRPAGKKGGMSAAGRAAISRAAKKRWAAWRKAKGKK